MDQDPEVIKHEIEATRSRMGDTVEALAYKTDVGARARDAVSDRVDAIKGKVSGAIGTATSAIGGVTDAIPSREEAAQRFGELRSLAAGNPLGLAIGSVAVGFLIGLAVPVTRIERERVGPIGEQLTDAARSAANDAIEQGKTAVAQAVGDAIGESPGGTAPTT